MIAARTASMSPSLADFRSMMLSSTRRDWLIDLVFSAASSRCFGASFRMTTDCPSSCGTGQVSVTIDVNTDDMTALLGEWAAGVSATVAPKASRRIQALRLGDGAGRHERRFE